jgi:membrane fusion protein, multidrug efflux system
MTDMDKPNKGGEAASNNRQTLGFEDDKGSRRSTWIAAFLLVAIVGWMASGLVIPSDDGGPVIRSVEPLPIAVAVTQSEAKPVTLYFQAEGQALPDRDTAIRSELSGNVAEVFVSKGEDVREGALIARLSTTGAEADIIQAQKEVENAERELANARQLLERGVATVDRVQTAEADLAASVAKMTAAQEALESAVITAPFNGRIETMTLDAGEFISAGTEVGRIVDNTPLTVAIQVPQQQLNRITNGQVAEVRFITGETREGTVAFVGTSASAETRTFLAEIEVANTDGAIPAGISAEIIIPTGETQAHFVSPSVISLSPEGVTGIKTVEDDKVIFYEIQVVRAEIDGIWVTGLPDEARVISVGQGFVREGETVRASDAEVETGTDDLVSR